MSRQRWWAAAAFAAYVLVMVAGIAVAPDIREGNAIGSLVWGTVGLGLVVGAALCLNVTAWAWRGRGITVVGRVVDWNQYDGEGNFPVVEYTTVTGRVHRYEAGRSRLTRSLSSMDIVYDPERPGRAGGRLTVWRIFVAGILFVTGAFILGASIVLFPT